ncbi:hypothetical protein GCM10023165_04330 [Variovorax defluvii]|uniref:Lipoprotein n=1 Tax=Variovorax defluvii TaxID=913761 RepID=A0ABP8GVX9_9BURK
MKRAACLVVLSAAAMLLAACGEKPQTNAEGVKLDAAPWTGTGAKADAGTAFTASGWKVGDKAAWEQQLKTRAQNGQNDYTRN